MRRITKQAGNEPQPLTDWKRSNPRSVYADLTEVEREAIRHQSTTEQFYICAYCGKAISGTNSDTMNEHVEARRIAPNRSLDLANIVASCNTSNQCDDSHASQILPLTPLMAECETELTYSLSGRVSGTTERANIAIQVLNLGDTERNNRSLVEQRKQYIFTLLSVNGINPDDGLDDDELLEMVIDDLAKPSDGKLEPFSPAAINVLKKWVA
ncbi:TIGR02646 family protein [Photobacterium carnosum]|uniref:TIGR02646 family protein n=1 Tax=Photobacterium carnosum TaxID=2023717 RepID=UPI001E4F4C0F|nr:TIGR02646 family protein [Photobacterium carnosum]MCD9514198.1 TIGR02646 family protein [Photobacterium carnosum]